MPRFRCHIPQNNKSFQIPGTRDELRIVFQLSETEIPKALRILFFRGQMFRVFFQKLEVVSAITKSTDSAKSSMILSETPLEIVRKLGKPLEVWACLSARDSAIKISGTGDGMQISLTIPSLTDSMLVKLLDLRERYLELYIPERPSTKQKVKVLQSPAKDSIQRRS